MSKPRPLPPELERAVKMAHRSPTYALTLLDGRVLHIRREAIAIRKNGTADLQKLHKGGGDVVWWVRCGDSETTGKDLGAVLRRVTCPPLAEDDADGHWEQVKILFSTALALADAAVPCEQQAVTAE
jgi:hypothetical protein